MRFKKGDLVVGRYDDERCAGHIRHIEPGREKSRYPITIVGISSSRIFAVNEVCYAAMSFGGPVETLR